MHCSATADKQTGSSSLLFGLSGTGKTTLSADPKRYLIGDDEHCWSDQGIFNIEGGCYAKAINLTPENEPEIFEALRFGAVLENVVLDQDHLVDYTNISLTENTRGALPMQFIQNAKIPCVAGHPTDIIFLTCGAFGVLPPVSSLSPAEAMYHYISGSTSKVAGTEVGSNGPRGNVVILFWRPVSGVASKQICRTACRQDETTRRTRVAGEHWLERWRLWHRQADQTGEHPSDRRCHPQWGTRQGENRARSGVRLRRGDRMPKRACRNSDSAQCLGR